MTFYASEIRLQELTPKNISRIIGIKNAHSDEACTCHLNENGSEIGYIIDVDSAYNLSQHWVVPQQLLLVDDAAWILPYLYDAGDKLEGMFLRNFTKVIITQAQLLVLHKFIENNLCFILDQQPK